MANGTRQHASWGIGLCVCIVAVCLATDAAALDLRVQGRSSLDLEVRTAGTRLIVDGQLRDDLDQPLLLRSVRLRVLEEVTREEVAAQTVETNRGGRFSTTFDVPPGEYRVRGAFDATPHVVGTEVDRAVRIRPEPVELSIVGPSVVRPSDDPVEIRVRGSVGGTGIALPVRVSGNGSAVSRYRLDETGRKRIDVSDVLEAGHNRIDVTVPEDSHRERAVEHIDIWYASDVHLDASVESVFDRFERGAAVSGRITSDGEPVPNASVEAVLVTQGAGSFGPDAGSSTDAGRTASARRKRWTASGETDGDGNFRILFSRENLIDGTWSASVRFVPDVGPAVGRDAGSVEVDRTVSRFIVNGAAGIALLAVVLLVLRELWRVIRRRIELWRRRSKATEKRRRAFAEEATLEAVPVTEQPPDMPGDSGALDTVRGQVWDVWREHPVAGASVVLRDGATEARLEGVETDEHGYFTFEELGSGGLELVIEADFYVRGRFSFDVPHDGELNPCRFELIPVPLKIRRLYQSLIELAHGEDLWGELAPSEIRETVSEALDAAAVDVSESEQPFLRRIRALAAGESEGLETSREYLEALTGLVEETYFGPRNYGESTWHVARRIALELRERLESDD